MPTDPEEPRVETRVEWRPVFRCSDGELRPSFFTAKSRAEAADKWGNNKHVKYFEKVETRTTITREAV